MAEVKHSVVAPSTSASASDYITVDENDWQSEMLKRIQDSAAPIPIKVACTTSPPGKASYLGEEYHGKITREEEKRILEGKSGRYIVRDSFSAHRPDEYTLAFNHDSEIKHIKLIYNTVTGQFKTDSNINEFKTVLDLMTDVLSLFQDYKRRESSTPSVSSKKERYSKPHAFKSHSYKHPKWCDICGNFLWGFVNQGYKCEDCGINSHKTCTDSAPLPCSKVVHGRKISNNKDEDRILVKKNSKTDLTNGTTSQPSNYVIIHCKNQFSDQCSYFRQCSRFLSAFNIRDAYVDMSNPMTRCFCNECIKETSSSDSTAVTAYDNLKQWTRFQFKWEEDTLKRDVTNWEVVYFAVHPKFVTDLIKEFFHPPKDELQNNEEFVVAPSLAYTTQDMLNENWSYKFSDTQTLTELYAQTVLEVFLRPDCYEVMPKSETDIKAPENCDDPVIIPEHWKVKKKSDLYPKSILVKIFEK